MLPFSDAVDKYDRTSWCGLDAIYECVMLPNPNTQLLLDPQSADATDLKQHMITNHQLYGMTCYKLIQGEIGLSHEYFALTLDGRNLVAMALCIIDRTHGSGLYRFELQTLKVHPDHRRKHLGSWLMMHLLESCDRHQPPRVINLTSLKETVDFYKRFGFKRINTGNWDMRRQPRLNLLREVMRPVGRPYMGITHNEEDFTDSGDYGDGGLR